jgi:hypothetical protein
MKILTDQESGQWCRSRGFDVYDTRGQSGELPHPTGAQCKETANFHNIAKSLSFGFSAVSANFAASTVNRNIPSTSCARRARWLFDSDAPRQNLKMRIKSTQSASSLPSPSTARLLDYLPRRGRSSTLSIQHFQP